MLADFNAQMVEVSLIGCRVEHEGRVPMGTTAPLQFVWESQLVKINAKVARSEFKSDGGRCVYVSGLQFCNAITDAPPAMRSIVTSLVGDMLKMIPRPAKASGAVPFLTSDPDETRKLSPYVECTFDNGTWRTMKTWSIRQPRDGFTVPNPGTAAEIERLCRDYELATPKTRSLIRAAAEVIMARGSR